jgi:hypothetical protein
MNVSRRPNDAHDAITKFRIVGRVVDRRTKEGVRGVRVEAWDKDIKYNDLLGSTSTNDRGYFVINFDTTYFREMYPEKAPDVFFRVFRGNRVIKSTEDTPLKDMNNNAEVTIEIESPAPPADGKDRINAVKALQIGTFFQQSDFKGVFRAGKSRSSATGSFISDMVINAVKSFEWTPLHADSEASSGIINKDTGQTRDTLEKKGVIIEEVKPYSAKMSLSALRDAASMPLTLKAGERVTLYEKDGVVKYYTVSPVSQPDAAQPDAAAMHNDMKEIRSRIYELEKSKQSTAETSNAITDGFSQDINDLKTQLAGVAQLREEVRQLRADSAKKDRTIDRLQKKITSLSRTANAADVSATVPKSTGVKKKSGGGKK